MNPENLPMIISDKRERTFTLPLEYNLAAPAAAAESDTVEASLPLSHYLWVLKRYRWNILGFITVCLIATFVASLRITPIYESTATVDIDRRIPTAILGQEATQASTNDSDQFISTQMKLVQSDGVLRPVDRLFNLRKIENSIAGGMKAEAEDAPVKLKNLVVTRPPNTYLLNISYRSTSPKLAADAANAIAKSFLEHTYAIRYEASSGLSAFMERQLEELKAKMERSSASLAAFERAMNVVNPEAKTDILSARLLQLNTDFTAAQSSRIGKEAARDSVGTGTQQALAASSQGEAIKRLSDKLNEVQQKFAETRILFGENHPEYQKAAAQIDVLRRQLEEARTDVAQRVGVEYQEAKGREGMLAAAVAASKLEFDRVNSRSFEYQGVKREAEADRKLYEELVRRIKEAEINAGFQSSSIRIADLARPNDVPFFPRIPLIMMAALVLSSMFAIAASVFADMLGTAVRDPDQISRLTKTPVIGTLPHINAWRGRMGVMSPGAREAQQMLPVRNGKEAIFSGYDEAIRTLRDTICLSDFDQRLRSVMLTSSVPSEGKSTIATHLAIASSQMGSRTLLIDGDLRRPSIHRGFNVPSNEGLSDVLVNGAKWRDLLVKPEGFQNLTLLLAGPPYMRASDSIGTLAALMEEARGEYDRVILDAPPLLGFPEPLRMAVLSDCVLVVALSGKTNRKALASTIATLRRVRANVLGVILNETRGDSGTGYYYSYHRNKYYAPSPAAGGAQSA
jgi:capsular exopolysaccharide synthesis family protein